ncbi:MAG: hypothetical protein OXI01_24630 [Albidovulum sp.]|nr:hypothetical protein [Albidovulum sp.]
MSKDPADAASSMGEAGTLYVAEKASRKSIVAGVGDLEDPGSVGMHKPAPADTESFSAKVGKVCARVRRSALGAVGLRGRWPRLLAGRAVGWACAANRCCHA